MGSYRVTRRFAFDAGHRLLRYEGPCGRLHGHHYVLEVTLEGTALDDLGILLDFAKMKELVQPILDEWDHKLLLAERDPVAETESVKPDIVLLPQVPTAEVMAETVFQRVSARMRELRLSSIRLANVRLYETPDCWVEYNPAATVISRFGSGVLVEGDSGESLGET